MYENTIQRGNTFEDHVINAHSCSLLFDHLVSKVHLQRLAGRTEIHAFAEYLHWQQLGERIRKSELSMSTHNLMFEQACQHKRPQKAIEGFSHAGPLRAL